MKTGTESLFLNDAMEKVPNQNDNDIVNPIFIYSDLQLICGYTTIDVTGDGKSIVFRVSSFRGAFKLLKSLKREALPITNLVDIHNYLKAVGITVYCQNTFFGILGFDAKPYLIRGLLTIYKLLPPAGDK